MRLTRKSSSFRPSTGAKRRAEPARPASGRTERRVWEVWNPDAVGRLIRTSALSVGGLITPIGLLIVTLMTVGR